MLFYNHLNSNTNSEDESDIDRVSGNEGVTVSGSHILDEWNIEINFFAK